ncbi:DUF3800 domain-containing protein [Bradyrhizobium sp. DASA03068]|uniref:DUF3800 domain-containing protein n=1 Tax=Bradyrhizobium sp. BLXBL-01 TaxID=3395915 RepID=UPI003F72C2C5
MHFFYCDETGCNGTDLVKNVQEQPIFVLGGISVRDEGWRKTYSDFQALVATYFDGNLPPGFELHASELLSPNGDGPFTGMSRDNRNGLAQKVLKLIYDRGHAVHFIALDKAKIDGLAVGDEHNAFNSSVPYLLAYNYTVSYVERFCKIKLGKSARGMIIADPKEEFDEDVRKMIHYYRRYEAPNSAALKWVVEFSYAIDSKRHPMIQISDLVIFLARKFLEMECGFRENWPDNAKTFYAKCYDMIQSQVLWKDIIPHTGTAERKCHKLLDQVRATHRAQWRRHYNL